LGSIIYRLLHGEEVHENKGTLNRASHTLYGVHAHLVVVYEGLHMANPYHHISIYTGHKSH